METKDDREILVEAPRAMGKSEHINDVIIIPYIPYIPEEPKGEVKHEPEPNPDLLNIFTEFSRDITLDDIDAPEIKKEVIKLYALLKRIYISLGKEFTMPKYKFEQIYKVYKDLEKKTIEDIKIKQDRLTEIDRIIKKKEKSLDLENVEETLKALDSKEINDLYDEKTKILLTLKVKNAQRDSYKSTSTFAFANDKRFKDAYSIVQFALEIMTILYATIVLNKREEALAEVLKEHDDETVEKVEACIDNIIRLLDTEYNMIDLMEGKMESISQKVDFFRNGTSLAILKMSELFGFDMVDPNLNLDEEEKNKLIVKQGAIRLRKLITDADPEVRLAVDEKKSIGEILKLYDMYSGLDIADSMKSVTDMDKTSKEFTVKHKIPQLEKLADIMFKPMSEDEDTRNKEISTMRKLWVTVVFSLTTAGTVELIPYLI